MAELGQHAVAKGIDRFAALRVHGGREAAAAQLRDFGAGLADQLFTAAGGDDVGSRFGQSESDGKAQTRGASHDHGHTARQIQRFKHSHSSR